VFIQPDDIITIALLIALEGLLSADNAMVLAVLVLGLPKEQQQKALRYGILGAFGFRAIATLFAMHMMGLSIVKLIGGLYLLYLSYRHFFSSESAEGRRGVPKATDWLGLGIFWSTVLKVELTDIVFAIDSILVAVAMSNKLWVVLTGGILGIVMMRLVIGQLLVIVQRYPPLVDGAFVIIGWVAIKLLMEYLNAIHYVHFEISRWFSLGLIVVIFAVALVYARRDERRRRRRSVDEKTTRLLMGEDVGDGHERPSRKTVHVAGDRRDE
jgi:YkoY family integral membrane protein